MKLIISILMLFSSCGMAQERHSLEYYTAAVEIIRADSVLSETFFLKKHYDNVFHIEVSDSIVPYLPKLYQRHTDIKLSSKFLEDFGISKNDIVDLRKIDMSYRSRSKIKSIYLPELKQFSSQGHPLIKIFFSELYAIKGFPNKIMVIADAFLIREFYENSPYTKLRRMLSGVTYILEFDSNVKLLSVIQSPFTN